MAQRGKRNLVKLQQIRLTNGKQLWKGPKSLSSYTMSSTIGFELDLIIWLYCKCAETIRQIIYQETVGANVNQIMSHSSTKPKLNPICGLSADAWKLQRCDGRAVDGRKNGRRDGRKTKAISLSHSNFVGGGQKFYTKVKLAYCKHIGVNFDTCHHAIISHMFYPTF